MSFTGGTEVGKRIAGRVGYKKLCLELGGNASLIVFDDADMDLAVRLAAEGSYRNSGQRCTAVKRILVQRERVDEITERLVSMTGEYIVGDPADPATRIGTVINETSAIDLEKRVQEAAAAGARVLCGGGRKGAQIEPTVIADVPRDARMVVTESFGPLAPIMAFDDIEDAVAVANSSNFGLAAGVVTRDIDRAMSLVHRLDVGVVNINQIPGYRTECAPFGGFKDSGLGIKEGVIEATRFFSRVKTFSLPQP